MLCGGMNMKYIQGGIKMFKVGDRVKIVSIDSNVNKVFFQRIGVIDKINEKEPYCYHIEFFNDDLKKEEKYYWWAEHNIIITEECNDRNINYDDVCDIYARLESRKRENELFPNIGQSVLLLLGLFGIQLVVGIFMEFFAAVTGIKYLNGSNVNNTIITVLISYVILVALCNKKTGNSVKKMFKNSSVSKKSLVYSILMILSWWCVIIPLISIALNSSKILLNAGYELSKNLKFMGSTSLGYFYIILLGPLFEEIIYRGIILRGLLKNHSMNKAIIISALIFGIMHFNFVQSFSAFGIGIILALIYVKTGSLKLCFLVHVVNNTFVGILGRFVTGNNAYYILTFGFAVFITLTVLIYRSPNKLQLNSVKNEIKSN